jgi:hypothetical protein
MTKSVVGEIVKECENVESRENVQKGERDPETMNGMKG